MQSSPLCGLSPSVSGDYQVDAELCLLMHLVFAKVLAMTDENPLSLSRLLKCFSSNYFPAPSLDLFLLHSQKSRSEAKTRLLRQVLFRMPSAKMGQL
jgi:hypothetical protein